MQCVTFPPTTYDNASASKLTRARVEGKEAAVRKVIEDDLAGRMPGWKYTLTASQIEMVVEYLKSVE